MSTGDLKPKGVLTAAERRCLNAWKEAKRKHGISPTAQEVAAELGGHSRNNAAMLLRRLAAKGSLVDTGRKTRRYQIPSVRRVQVEPPVAVEVTV